MTDEFKELKEEAYDMGFKRGGVEPDIANEMFEKEKVSEDKANQELGMNFDHYTSYAGWSNHVLPRLRAMAGFEGSGHGTYQEVPEDEDRIELDEKLDELVMAFERGMVDSGLQDLKQMGKIKGYKKSEKVS